MTYEVTLHYTFEIRGRQIILSDGRDDGYESDEYDYDYDVEISDEDIVDYLTPPILDSDRTDGWKERRKLYRDGMRKVISEMPEDALESMFDCLTDDDAFMEYLHDEYEEDARQASEED